MYFPCSSSATSPPFPYTITRQLTSAVAFQGLLKGHRLFQLRLHAAPVQPQAAKGVHDTQRTTAGGHGFAAATDGVRCNEGRGEAGPKH